MLSPRVRCSYCHNQAAEPLITAEEFLVVQTDDGNSSRIRNPAEQRRLLQDISQIQGKPLPTLCKDCMNITEEYLKKETLSFPLENYKQALKHLHNSPEEEEFESESEEEEERILMAEIEALLKKSASLRDQIKEEEREHENIDKKFDELWGTHSTDVFHQQKLSESSTMNELSFETTKALLSSLGSKVMIQDLFRLDFSGLDTTTYRTTRVGTINGLRLGKLSASDPPWDEINAGLGHIAFLITTISKWLNTTRGENWKKSPLLREWRVVPSGSFSRLERRSDATQLPLHFDGAVSQQMKSVFTFVFEEPGFDRAISTLVGVIGELIAFAKRDDPECFLTSFVHIYIIDQQQQVVVLDNATKKPIKSCTLKYHKSSYEDWTIGLCLLLRVVDPLLQWFQKNISAHLDSQNVPEIAPPQIVVNSPKQDPQSSKF